MTLVALIVAADEQGGIGLGGRLPWHLPEDLKRFKALTMGYPVLMGRKTYESIGRPLPGRQNIVVTRRQGLAIPGCAVADSLASALEATVGAEKVFIIGGAELYGTALPYADTVYLTRVHATVGADTFVPALDAAEWEEISREDREADGRHAHAYSFIVLRRRT